MVRRRHGQISRRKDRASAFSSLGDLGDYYRQFYTITTFLRGKQRLSAAEQSRAFVQGFQPDLWSRISQRLQLKLPDHFPDDPYDLIEIHEAAQVRPARNTLHPFDTAFATYPSCRIDNHIELDIGVARSKSRTSLR